MTALPNDDVLDAAVQALRRLPVPECPAEDLFAIISAIGVGDMVNPRRWRRRLVAATVLAACAMVGVGWACFVLWSKPPQVAREIAGHEEPADPWTGTPIFEDVTAQSGIDFKFRNGEEAGHYVILESLGGGVALIDYDGDGLLDVFLTGGGHFDKSAQDYPGRDVRGADKKWRETEAYQEAMRQAPPRVLGYPCKLYKNLGNFKFKDVTKDVGLDQPLFFSHGAAVCDYNKDGWPDLLVTGYGRLALFKNVPGPNNTRCFVDVTREAGLDGPHFWGTSAAWADFDGDGYPDVYVCQYVNWSWQNNPLCSGYSSKFRNDICPPKQFKARQHRLYHNDGNGHFTEVAASAGIRVDRTAQAKPLEERLHKLTDGGKLSDDQLSPDRRQLRKQLEEEIEQAKSEEFGKGLGVVVVDVNGDGKPDIFVANDTVDRFLYINRSRPGEMKFEEVGMAAGVAKDDQGVAQGAMGVDAGDPYGSGLPALWTTNYEGELHALFRNDLRNGHLSFQFNTAPAGIAAIGQLFVGFGTGFVDLDNDGWEDIFISNGHVIRHPCPAALQQSPIMFLNQGHGKFKETKAGGAYFQTGHRGRGVAIGDLDNDGRPDVIISHVQEPVAILRNIADTGNHWLGVKLAARDHRLPVGATLVLETAGRKLTRFAKGGGSYLSANDTRHLFGLGKATKTGRLTIDWPSGTPRREYWDDLDIDQYHTIVQGTGKQITGR
jgi:hypothetical protein